MYFTFMKKKESSFCRVQLLQISVSYGWLCMTDMYVSSLTHKANGAGGLVCDRRMIEWLCFGMTVCGAVVMEINKPNG